MPGPMKKKRKVDEEGEVVTGNAVTVVVEFRSEEGELAGPQVSLPVETSVEQMDSLVNKLLQNEETVPYTFFLNEEEITADKLSEHLLAKSKEEWLAKMKKEGRRVTQKMLDSVPLKVDLEDTLKITYRPQAVFKVRSLTRCTATLSGHSEAVLVCAFSPESERLATGSGDNTIILWDLNTQTPAATLSHHTQWVQVLAWSPNGRFLASGSKDTKLCLWEDDKLFCEMKGHRAWINAVSWEPLHRNVECNRFCSASKDCTIKIWLATKAKGSQLLTTLSGHTASVTCVKWGGLGKIYSGSQDRSVRVWDADEGTLLHKLDGHGHWVNSLALNTDIVLRSGAFDHTGQKFTTPAEAADYARKRFEEVAAKGERLVSCSDDHTLFLWSPDDSKKPLARLTGHQGVVCNVSFSPDGRTIASASFDKSVKLWNAQDGKYVASLRGHVGAVYFVAWSIDSRQILTASKDTTLKLWSMKTKKLINDLPGHLDEVYACDWSPDGMHACSGSKDKTVKVWRH